ncbi:MAG: hypothetical protein HC916_10825 [Coleofasciculaceae cyanobacterium SM2_1_6]|nr:hypothetical protein [Coleofasciculaceae cyanobacterium SM2_1_6]
MKGTRDLNFYQPEQIKQVRLVRRADGYYAQFCIQVERSEISATSTSLSTSRLSAGASNASGDVTSTLVEVIQSGQVVSMKEESHAL